jgi:tetratricopeptide (TPR) repeat protein
MNTISLSRRFWFAAVLMLSLALPAQSLHAATPDERFLKASESYAAGEFADAVYDLRELTNDGIFSAGALHNLGDAEWKVGRHGHAVLAWERALSLNPFSKNTEANLRFARSQAHVDAPVLTWFERYSAALPGGWWIAIASAGLWGGVALLTLPRLLGWRRADWHQGVAAALLAIFLLSGPALLGVWRRAQFGVVLEDETPLRLTPTREAEMLVKLTSGEMARVERERGEYFYVRADGDRTGWVRKADFARVWPL